MQFLRVLCHFREVLAKKGSEVSEALCHYGPTVTRWLYESAFQKLDLNKLKRKKRKKAKRIMEPWNSLRALDKEVTSLLCEDTPATNMMSAPSKC
eukprot:s739_g8.t1